MSRTLPALLFVLCAIAAQAAGGVGAVLRVRDMVGEEAWSRAVWIENRDAGKGARYPRRFPALVFALQGMLWIYTPVDGTQSLSQYRGRLARDQENFGPLLTEIEPGLRVQHDLGTEPDADASAEGVPFACFPECVAKWRELRASGVEIAEARILNYYMPVRSGQKGHAVLEYRIGELRFVFDPAHPGDVRAVPGDEDDPLAVLREFARQRFERSPTKVMALHLDPGAGLEHHPRIAVRRETGAGSNRSAFMR